MIPIKDASLIARCDDPAIRREWRSRLVDHDGEGADDGGIARWLRLTDGLGLDREYVTSLRGLLPATRFAVDAYVRFVREKTPARSHRLVADRDVLAADHQRAGRGHAGELSVRHPRDARLFRQAAAAGRSATPISRSTIARQNARTPEQQQQVLAALEFKCSVLWAMCDALQHAYVEPKEIPPGAFVPERLIERRRRGYCCLLTSRTIGHHSFSSLSMNSPVCAGV